MKEQYVIAAFKVDQAKSILYRKYTRVTSAGKGVVEALLAEADYISIRRIRVAEG